MRDVLHADAAAVTPQRIHHIVGLDLGDRWSRYCVLDETGVAVEEDRSRTTVAGVERRFSGKSTLRIVLEAGAHSPWVSRLLESYQHQVVVANPRKVRLIYESDRKNDRLDARMLARLGRLDMNLLAPVRHRDVGETETASWAEKALHGQHPHGRRFCSGERTRVQQASTSFNKADAIPWHANT